MPPRSRRFALLVALPLCLALVLWPVAQHYQARARARAATLELRAAINRDFGGRGYLSLARVAPLLQVGGDVNVRGINQMTMLHCLAMRLGSPPALQATDSESARATLTRYLLAHGADPDAYAPRNGLMRNTPLMVAALHARSQVVAALLQGGANANVDKSENEKPGPNGKKEVRTALTIARETLDDLKATDITTDDVSSSPRELREYKTNLSEAQRTVALLQAATTHH